MQLKNIHVYIATFAAGVTTFAGPLDKSNVAKDAKWLLHLDFDAFRQTKLGSYLTDKVLQPKLEEAENSKKLNLSINFKNISSVTAYGPTFAKEGEGVLLLNSTADVKKDLDTIVGMATLAGNNAVTMSQAEPYPVYTFNNNLFLAPGSGSTFLIAKSREQIENARQVLLGKSDSLAGSKSFSDFPGAPGTFFFLGMAEGFNENLPIPPQAQVLKETTGGRLVLGEQGENIFANLVFKGKDAESTTKIQQVLQGLVALVSLTQAENKDLVEIAGKTKISSESRNVIVELQLPIQKAIQKINEKEEEKRSEPDSKKS